LGITTGFLTSDPTQRCGFPSLFSPVSQIFNLINYRSGRTSYLNTA
jgi:hypothetical protein